MRPTALDLFLPVAVGALGGLAACLIIVTWGAWAGALLAAPVVAAYLVVGLRR